MTDQENPFQIPATENDKVLRQSPMDGGVSRGVLIKWSLLFTLALLLPGLFAISASNDHAYFELDPIDPTQYSFEMSCYLDDNGYLGVVSAIILLLCVGTRILIAMPKHSPSFVMSAGVIASAQLLTILYIVSHLIFLFRNDGANQFFNPTNSGEALGYSASIEFQAFLFQLLAGSALLALNVGLSVLFHTVISAAERRAASHRAR